VPIQTALIRSAAIRTGMSQTQRFQTF